MQETIVDLTTGEITVVDVPAEEVAARIAAAQAAEAATPYTEKRAAEYPDFKEYLDGIVKGDQGQIDKYIADCLAVKAKYPKPE